MITKKICINNLNLLIAAAFAIILVDACKSTGMQAFTQGQYYTACLQAIDKLRSSPDNTKATDVLQQAYPLAVNYTEKEAEHLLKSASDNNRYQKMFELYSTMNAIAEQIARCPAALQIIPNADYYSSQLETARNMAAEESYAQAVDNLRTGTRSAARQAYAQFQKTNSIIQGYKDVINKLQEAKWLATLKVVLEQIPVEGRYKISADFFQNKVFEYFSNSIRNEFINIFSPEEAESMNLQPDQIIRLRFFDFAVGQTRESRNSYEVKRDSVKTGTYKDDNGVSHNIYGTVKAKITVKQIEVSSKGILEAFIIDCRTNTTLSQQRFPGTYLWTDSYASFNGDERALSSKELDMCRRTQPASPPPPQEMFIQFTVPIFNNLTRFIQNYYRKY
ncbi:MAG: hypothetical protein LBP85_00435 [Prevotellaceae bacterium]|jgi:hypothetical protein|nr:hypothetical protein [Prevotellaceae bacterium]